MDNSSAFFRSGWGSSTKKREKSRVSWHRVDRCIQICSSLSADLPAVRFFEAKALLVSGRFNGNGPGEGTSLVDSIDCRAYSGPQVARYLAAMGAVEVQIGSRQPVSRPSRSIWSSARSSSAGLIWPSLREKAYLKPLSADSYLPYLDTI